MIDNVALVLYIAGICFLLLAVGLAYRTRTREEDERRRRTAAVWMVAFGVSALGVAVLAVANVINR